MKKIVIYTMKSCGFCIRAKDLLKKLNMNFEEIPVDDDDELWEKVSKENDGYDSVPMIFIDDKFIGGYSDLVALQQKNLL